MILHIFDFDGTLFRSPPPPPGEGFLWYAQANSLGHPAVPEKPGDEWWNMKLVARAAKSIADPDVKAVMVTGRTGKNAEMRKRVLELLNQRGLHFDETFFSHGGNTASFKAGVLSKMSHAGVTDVEVWDDREDNVKRMQKSVAGDVKFVGHTVPRATSPARQSECVSLSRELLMLLAI